MLSRLRNLNKINILQKNNICSISLKNNNAAGTFGDKILQKNNNINKMMIDIKTIQNTYNDLDEYKIMKFLLNYKSYNENRYDLTNIMEDIEEIRKITKLKNDQILEIILLNKSNDNIKEKNNKDIIENITRMMLLFGCGYILVKL